MTPTPAAPAATHDVAALFRRAARPLERVVAGGLPSGDRAGVEDACQTAWTRLLRIGDGREGATTFAWLLTTAQREARRHQQRAARESSLEALLDAHGDAGPTPIRAVHGVAPDPYDRAVARERIGRLRALPERQRRLLWLQVAGYSYEEISARTGCTPRTVERQLARARHRITVGDGDGR